jgi:hypothetical protein
VAGNYFDDGSIEAACPPLKALLHIMAYGQFEGKDATSPEIRAMFGREALLESEWYQERLRAKQERDIALWRRHVASLEAFQPRSGVAIDIQGRLSAAREQLARVSDPAYLGELTGTIGADPFASA